MNKELLQQYFLNRLNDVEREQVVAWMRDPANEAELQQWMQEHWKAFAAAETTQPISTESMWRNIQNSMDEPAAIPVATAEPAVVPVAKTNHLWKYLVAAAVLFTVVSGYLMFKSATAGDPHLAAYGKDIVQQTNLTATTKRIVLEDASVVVLRPHASVTYPAHFSNSKREVSLAGEAFFEVTRNPQRPFLVYSNNIVTKVLGTSFTITANTAAKDMKVVVHTGRVQVFENTAEDNDERGVLVKSTNGVIITANQQTVYSAASHHFETMLADMPVPIPHVSIAAGYFDFNRQPVSVVLSHIQQVYGIEFVLEQENLGKCIFSGDMTEENLFEKLNILCTAINASYEIAGTRVLIKGSGCTAK